MKAPLADADILLSPRPLGDILLDVTVGDAKAELPPPKRADLLADVGRKHWNNNADLSRCDFSFHPDITRRGDTWFLSIWRKSPLGKTLVDIKSDPAEIPRFAAAVSDFLLNVLGSLSSDWAIVTTPKRRHKTNNFAAAIAAEIATRLSIPFVDDVAAARNRQRVNAVFHLVNLPVQQNIIVFDDFVTTGSTLKAMRQLLEPFGKTLVFIAGINNG